MQFLVDTSGICYKEDKISETPFYFRIPTVLAKEMIQPYWDESQKKYVNEFKSAEALKKGIIIDYMTGKQTNVLPVFENHPHKEDKRLEVGFVKNIRYNPKYNGLVGIAHISKKMVTEPTYRKMKEGGKMGVSIGFYRDVGLPGIYNGREYNISQENLKYTHMAILPFTKGRCSIKDGCGLGFTTDSISSDMGVSRIDNIERRIIFTSNVKEYQSHLKAFQSILNRKKDSIFNFPAHLFDGCNYKIFPVGKKKKKKKDSSDDDDDDSNVFSTELIQGIKGETQKELREVEEKARKNKTWEVMGEGGGQWGFPKLRREQGIGETEEEKQRTKEWKERHKAEQRKKEYEKRRRGR